MGSIALVGAGGLAVTSFIAWLVAGQILAPLRDLRRVAASITDSDLSQRVPVVGHDEIAQLAQTFNGMLDRLERSYRDQRQFVDDAGHELRTPITVIRGQLELLNDASYEERERSISLTIDELDRMARIVNDLLTLAIADSADFVHPTMVDAAELTIDIEDKTHVMATRTIRLTAVAEGMVYVDEQRITQAMWNFFNKLFATPQITTPLRLVVRLSAKVRTAFYACGLEILAPVFRPTFFRGYLNVLVADVAPLNGIMVQD